MEEDIEEIEENLDHLLEELNESQLYAQTLEHKMLTAPKRQRYIESLIERLETTRRSLGDFNLVLRVAKKLAGTSRRRSEIGQSFGKSQTFGLGSSF